MSNYRDDTQETAVASDSTWASIVAVTEELARIAGTLAFGLTVLHASQAVAADEILDNATSLVTERATAFDETWGVRRTQALTAEQAKVTERWVFDLRVMHEDAATAADTILDAVRTTTTEQAMATDEVIASRYVALQAASVAIEESVKATDFTRSTLRASVLATDTAIASDEAPDGQRMAALAVEKARAADTVTDQLHARDLVTDTAAMEDAAEGNLPYSGQAWVANADTWAMTRYVPYAFVGLEVIDGRAYGMAEDGVYALDGGNESISGQIQTGKLDIGQGVLTLPVSAYLEYELDGTAEMDVTTTQRGQPETYT